MHDAIYTTKFEVIYTLIPVHSAIIHIATTTHLYEQAMYCTHLRVWSVELWASAAPMCCAPPGPMLLYSRLYAHVCVRIFIQRTRVGHYKCEVMYIYHAMPFMYTTYVHAQNVPT
jgi:hypothetical protein